MTSSMTNDNKISCFGGNSRMKLVAGDANDVVFIMTVPRNLRADQIYLQLFD